MPVNITLKGSTETSDEYQAASVLKSIFERDLPKNVNGEILIYPNVTLFGQRVKDIDIVVIGKFDNYSTEINTKIKCPESYGDELCGTRQRNVYINNFVFVIELKTQSIGGFRIEGQDLMVTYNNKKHSVTVQSENQKYSLTDYLRERGFKPPYICNFVWLRNVSPESIRDLVGFETANRTPKHNYLPTNFSLNYLFSAACAQRFPFTGNPHGDDASFTSFITPKGQEPYDSQDIEKVFQIFNRVKEGAGEMTRKKVAYITRKFLKDQDYVKALGKKLVIISGRAGTGKTIKLLTIACDLALRQGARCLILTFNTALVSDIKRMIALSDISDKPDSYTVEIKTLDKFFYEILKGFRVGVKEEKNENGEIFYKLDDYIDKREEKLSELLEYLQQGLLGEKDIQDLMKSNHDAIAWDYILIDEGQDWSEKEKEIIFRIFGSKNVVVADGVDQMIRARKKCLWSRNLRKDDEYEQTYANKGLRQEVNLTSFVNNFALRNDLGWSVEPKEEMLGGKVIVSLKPYSKELHERLFRGVVSSKNGAYEMLFLVPPSLVKKTYASNPGQETKSSFTLRHDFEKIGIKIWDGTNRDLRSEYPVDPNERRVLQYDSCRGLEGWCVVCLDFDDFVKYKWETFKEEERNPDSLQLDTSVEDRKRFVNLWLLIPLTRAIDTLVITIRDRNSDICKTLRKMHEEHPDYVEWIE